MGDNGASLFDNDTELSVLSSMLTLQDDGYYFLGKLSPDHFYNPVNRKIFLAIKDSVEEFGQPDISQIKTLAGDACKISDLLLIAHENPIAINPEFHVRRLKELEAGRRLLEKISSITSELSGGKKPVPDIIERAHADIIGINIHDTGDTCKMLCDCITDQDARMNSKKQPGIKTGFYDLDEILIGFEPGDLAIVAGRPSMGKTAFALDLARNMAGTAPGYIQSIEMPEPQLTDRLLSAKSGVNGGCFRRRQFTDRDKKMVDTARVQLDDLPIMIDDDGGATLAKIQVNAMKHTHISKIKWLMVDYLQLIPGKKGRSRDEDVGEITSSLKRLAKQLGIVVILLSQLNRKCEERHDKKPMLSDLRDSGSIEQDADEVMLIWRGSYYFDKKTEYEGKAEVHLAKNRNGPTGCVELGFSKECATFFNLQKGF